MNRDTLSLAILLGLIVIALTTLSLAGAPIPDQMGYVASALVGAYVRGIDPANTRRPEDVA